MQPTEDERVLAALSHASIVANVVNLAGMIATALIWTMQRERSRYVRAHALQSLVYQGMVLVISILLTLFWGVCLVLSLLPVALRPDLYHVSNPPKSFWLALIGLAVPVGFGIGATIYGLYGAYRVYRGRSFHYPLVGRLVRRELAYANPLNTSPAAVPEAPTAVPVAAPVPAPGIYEASVPVASAPAATAEHPAAEEPPPALDTAQQPKRRGRRQPPS